MNGELLTVLEHLEREKGIHREVLIRAIESSLVSASKKMVGKADNISVKIDDKTGEIKVFAIYDVVAEVVTVGKEVSLAEAKTMDASAKIGGVVSREITDEFGRIAAQTAKQVIIQKIREAEKEIVYDEYKSRVGDIVNGVIRRTEYGAIMVDLGRTEAVLPQKEQCITDTYSSGYRMRFYVVDVRITSKGPSVVLSRTHPGLVQKLFELEVPEINDGSVEIKGVAREPGYRSKIAVESKQDKIDSVGACVGLRGERVKNIVRELNGEKIDIIPYSNNISLFVEKALSPAKIDSIKVYDKKKQIEVIVPPDQFSLAIGKKGQNARLTSILVGWKVDIRRKDDPSRIDVDAGNNVSISNIPGLPSNIEHEIISSGFNTIEALETITLDSLKEIKGVGDKTAPKILQVIQEYVNKQKSRTKLDSIIEEKSRELKNLS